jgi:hypothetical protein
MLIFQIKEEKHHYIEVCYRKFHRVYHYFKIILKASYWGNEEVAKLLINSNACLSIKDNYGTTALDLGLWS